MLVAVGSTWRVTEAFQATPLGFEGIGHFAIEPGALLVVVPAVDLPEGNGDASIPRIKFRLSDRPYWTYERDLVTSARCVA